MSKKYEIRTFEQLCNVANTENVDRLLIDFAQWLAFYVIMLEEARKENPELTEGKANWEIITGGFMWVDDGKNDMLGVSFITQETGEKTEIKFDTQTENY